VKQVDPAHRSAAGHPLRQALRIARLRRRVRCRSVRSRTVPSSEEVRQFLLAYCACLLAAGAFLA
jgi:hypothetical protein